LFVAGASVPRCHFGRVPPRAYLPSSANDPGFMVTCCVAALVRLPQVVPCPRTNMPRGDQKPPHHTRECTGGLHSRAGSAARVSCQAVLLLRALTASPPPRSCVDSSVYKRNQVPRLPPQSTPSSRHTSLRLSTGRGQGRAPVVPGRPRHQRHSGNQPYIPHQ